MEYRLQTPISRSDVEKLRIGDVVYLSGTLITARDKAHIRMAEYFSSGKPLPFRLEDAAVFHGAPIVRERDGGWEIVAIGPTTSARMNSLEPAVIRHGARLIIGKGGMDAQVRERAARLRKRVPVNDRRSGRPGRAQGESRHGRRVGGPGAGRSRLGTGGGRLRAADGDHGCARGQLAAMSGRASRKILKLCDPSSTDQTGGETRCAALAASTLT